MTFSQFVRSPLAPLFSLLALVLVVVPSLLAASNQAPSFTTVTSNLAFAAGVPNSFTLTASGSPAPTFSVSPGALPSWATLNPVTGVVSGQPPLGSGPSTTFVSITATNIVGSATQTFRVGVHEPVQALMGFSSRLDVSGAGNSIVFGVTGGTRTILLRAVGPGLSVYGVSGVLANPQIVVSDASTGSFVQSNDNWSSSDSATMAQVGAFSLTVGSLDSAIVASLAPGVYRATFSGVGQTSGVALMEFYDATPAGTNPGTITYLALHGPVGVGNAMMTAGVVMTKASGQTLIRALGPALGSTGTVVDPYFTVYNASGGYVMSNNDWENGGNSRSPSERVGARPLVSGSKDAAYNVSLDTGLYSIQVESLTGIAGRGVLEIFPASDRDIIRPPFVELESASQTLVVGQAGSLSAIAYGTGPITYQWRKNGVPIVGATNATLEFSNVTLGDQGTYDVSIANGLGSAFSTSVSVTVVIPVAPSIISQPVSGEFYAGNLVRFGVVVGGTGPLSYQWRKNGVPIPNARNTDHIFHANFPYDIGAYDVVVTNSAGTVTSERATLAMGQLPLASNPASQYVRSGDPVTLSAYASPDIAAAYAWYKGSAAVSRPATVYNLEGVAMGEIAAGQPVPPGRWTTPNGGAFYLAGIIGSQEGLIVGAANNPTYLIPSVSTTDLDAYSVDITANSSTERRGPASVALRGTGTLGRNFLAVGASGKILRSGNGQTWTSPVSGVANELRGAAVKGDVAVAVGVSGAILRSTNLDTWTRARNSTTDDLNAVVAGPDRFVAVGAGGRVLVSTDGVDWYHGRHRTHATLTGVAYGNGTYVMTGANGAVFASVDGFNWFNRNSQTTSEILFVTFAGAQFWALTTNNQLLTSPDGLTWSRSETVQPVWFRSLAYDGTSLVAVGVGGRIYTSPNGIAWTPRTSGTTENLRAVTWSGFEVPSGLSPSSILSDMDFRILTPPYAVTATVGQPATFSVTTSGAPTGYQWYKGATLIDGATGATFTIPSVQAGDAGGYYVKITSAAGELTSATAGLQFRGWGDLREQFVAVGEDGVVMTSGNGLEFTERLRLPGRVFRAVAASAFGIVAVGRDNTVATSPDGRVWFHRTLSLPGDSRILRGVAAGVSQFVAVGSAGTIIVSFDAGETWKLVPSGTPYGLWGVAWDGTRFVAVGEWGTVLTSRDGLAWEAAMSPLNLRLYAIYANGAKLVTVTEQGIAYETSNSGLSWTSVPSSGGLWVRGAAVGATGRRVIVGDRGIIATSAGGSIWNFSASPTTARLYGVTWTGPLGVVQGSMSEAIEAPILRITSEPQDVTGFAGGTATFSVGVGGVGPYQYQWFKNGVELAQQTQSTLLLTNLQPADAGNYSVEVRNANSIARSSSRAGALAVSVGSGSAPTLANSPASRSVSVGSATNFVVAADGQAPFTYRWYFNGNPISGAVSATLALTNVQMANAGSYTVTVSNRYGSITSAPAALTVTSVPGMPVISQQPASQAVAANGVAVFTVVATGTPTPSYQWRKDGNNIDGATQATYAVDPVQTASSGVYTVRVSNTVGEVISEPASLTVVPAGTTATHRQTGGRGYEAGGTVTITSTLTFVGQAQSAGWEVLLPAGWSYVSGGGAQGDIRPIAGETQLLSWAWTTPPASPITFTYTLQVPAGTVGAQALAAMAVLRQGGVPIRLMAQPDPLIIAPSSTLHVADTSGDQRIDLFELTRVIELYNTRNGSVRTGAYRIDAGGEDGFAGDSSRGANYSATLARYHSADTRNSGGSAVPDGALDLFELTRIIELYNHRVGNVRTGQYRVQAGTEDGFAPGP